MTDDPYNGDPDATDDDSDDAPKATENYAGCTDSKNPHNNWENTINISKKKHQKRFKNITDAANGDVKIATEYDAADSTNIAGNQECTTDSKITPYSLINRNCAPSAADGNSYSPNYSASADFLKDSKLKRKIDPSSIIKL